MAIATKSAIIPSTVSRTVAMRSVRRTTLSLANWSEACGSSSSTTNSITVGIAAGVVAHRPPNWRNDCDHCTARARINAPRYVSGRLRSRPTAAAANAGMISRASGPLVDMPASGASRIPASAASEQPRAHEKLETSSARAPVRLARLAVVDDGAHRRRRGAMRKSRRRSPMASATASARVKARAHVITTPAMWKPPLPKSGGSVWLRFWSQIMLARPMNANIRPDRHHELHDQLLALQVAHDRPVEPDADQRRDHEHGERHRDELRHPVVDRQLPVDVREEHPDRALREVEDPGRGVHDDESGRRHGVDAGQRQREDEQVDERRRRDRSVCPRRPAHADDQHGRRDDDQQVGPCLHGRSLIPCTPSRDRCVTCDRHDRCSRTCPASPGSTRTNLPFCTCMPIRHVLPTWPPMFVGAMKPLSSKFVMPWIGGEQRGAGEAVRAALRDDRPSRPWRRSDPRSTPARRTRRASCRTCRKLSSSALWPLSSNGRNDSQTYWFSTAEPPVVMSRWS